MALAYRRLNRRFHLRIRDISNSRVVSSVIENLGDLIDYVIITRSNKFRDRLLMAAAEHDALVGFIQNGDAEGATDCAAATSSPFPSPSDPTPWVILHSTLKF